mgnify:FL=1|jgi:hypothetical protein
MVMACFAKPSTALSQELNCKVEINSEKVKTANKEIFNTLKTAITEYLNDTKWTETQFSANEKINCRLYLTISNYDDASNKMTGDLQVQSSRPVYNSSYTTTVINFKDTKIDFTYQENEPLVFSEQEMQSNLTAILNFYAYMIIALDFDTFSLNGGTPYYEKAARIVKLAQSSGETGWKAFEDTKNRSAVLSAYTDKATSDIRELMYKYHRLGLDQMSVSVDKGRAVITESLSLLKKVYDAAPMSVCLSMFRDAKLDELVNIYSKASLTEKQSVYDVLNPIFPTEGKRLDKIRKEDTEQQ